MRSNKDIWESLSSQQHALAVAYMIGLGAGAEHAERVIGRIDPDKVHRMRVDFYEEDVITDYQEGRFDYGDPPEEAVEVEELIRVHPHLQAELWEAFHDGLKSGIRQRYFYQGRDPDANGG